MIGRKDGEIRGTSRRRAKTKQKKCKKIKETNQRQRRKEMLSSP